MLLSVEVLSVSYHFLDGQTYWALVNNVGDEAAKLATRLDAHAVQFFRQIVREGGFG